MPKNVNVLITEAKSVNQWNKQQVYVQNKDGVTIEVNLTADSPKLIKGKIGQYHRMDLWEFAKEGNPKKWYGKILDDTQSSSSRKKPNGETDWDAIAQGKVRCNLLQAILSNPNDTVIAMPPDEIKRVILDYTDFVMTGQYIAKEFQSPEKVLGEDSSDIPF